MRALIGACNPSVRPIHVFQADREVFLFVREEGTNKDYDVAEPREWSDSQAGVASTMFAALEASGELAVEDDDEDDEDDGGEEGDGEGDSDAEDEDEDDDRGLN